MITNDDIKKLKTIFLTKDDAKKFATKDDLKKFATKDDLKKFATKDDLKKFATKDDLKKFATKTDISKLATKAEQVKYATKDDLVELKNEIIDRMDEQYSQIFNLVDGLAIEIKDGRESREIFSYRIEDHEKRILKTEKLLTA